MVEILAVNGSPNKEKGNTARLLESFLEGTREAGAVTRVIYTMDINPRPCTGEMNCWYRTPGQCHQRDGMQDIYPILRNADILVLATPVYIPLPGEMQNFINRMCPLFRPQLSFANGRTKAMARDEVRLKGLVLVSTGAWWELANLEILDLIAKELAIKMDLKYFGAVLRPHALVMEDDQTKAEEIRQNTRLAGRQLIEDEKLSNDLLERISRPLIGEEDLRARWNVLEERARSRKK
jgi:multimeric flavodoxin WrbA